MLLNLRHGLPFLFQGVMGAMTALDRHGRPRTGAPSAPPGDEFHSWSDVNLWDGLRVECNRQRQKLQRSLSTPREGCRLMVGDKRFSVGGSGLCERRVPKLSRLPGEDGRCTHERRDVFT